MTFLPGRVLMRDPLFRSFLLFCRLQLGERIEDTPTFVQNWNFSTHIQLCSNVIVFFSLFVQKTNCLWVPCLKVLKWHKRKGMISFAFASLRERRKFSDTLYGQCKHGDIFGLHFWYLNGKIMLQLMQNKAWRIKKIGTSLKNYCYKAVWRNCRKRLKPMKHNTAICKFL